MLSAIGLNSSTEHRLPFLLFLQRCKLDIRVRPLTVRCHTIFVVSLSYRIVFDKEGKLMTGGCCLEADIAHLYNIHTFVVRKSPLISALACSPDSTTRIRGRRNETMWNNSTVERESGSLKGHRTQSK